MTIKSLEGVSKERILKEFMGMLGAPNFVSKGFPLMQKLGIDKCIPGLFEVFESLKRCTQNPEWHAEGAILKVKRGDSIIEISGDDFVDGGKDGEIVGVVKFGTVYEHTIHVMEEMEKQDHDAIDMLAAILHDIGKLPSGLTHGPKNPGDGFPRTYDHDIVGAPLAKQFCENLGMTNKDCDTIEWLVRHHMRAHQISSMKSKCKIWKFVSHPLFPRLIKLSRADERGCRKSAADAWEGIDGALARPDIAALVGVPMPERVLTGKDLIELGFKPGPNFAKALDKAYDFQIDNDITDKDELVKRVKGILLS